MSANLRIQTRKIRAAFFFEVYCQYRPYANPSKLEILVHLMEGSQTFFYFNQRSKMGLAVDQRGCGMSRIDI
jgi:hypothetical protein